MSKGRELKEKPNAILLGVLSKGFSRTQINSHLYFDVLQLKTHPKSLLMMKKKFAKSKNCEVYLPMHKHPEAI